MSLENTIALVTGSSRGAGRGIARALGDDGATVHVTGRSVADGATTDGLPGTIDGTATEVDERGGRGIAVRCDHTDDAQVEALFDRIADEHGRLDLLVNNVWGGYEAYDFETFDAPAWEQPYRERWAGMFEAGLRAHMVASVLAIPLMRSQGSGLIVSTTFWDRDHYLGNLFYDVSKAAINRAMLGLARELRDDGIAALALSPGFMRTERVLESVGDDFDLSATESPEYIGRAIVALAADDAVLQKSGKVFRVGDLAREYGFRDVDGSQPAPFEIA